MRSLLFSSLVLATSLILTSCAAAPPPVRPLTDEELATPSTLAIGDPAPPLAVQRWVRGTPLNNFKPGTVYVLDFWASWCGPCLASMPKLSRLEQAHQGRVVVVGITRLDPHNDLSDIRRSLRELGPSANFRIAIDDRSLTSQRYPDAVRVNFVPCSFIIDQRGRLAWYGHPKDLSPVLDAVLQETWDIDLARAEQIRRDDAAIRTRALTHEYLRAVEQRDLHAQLAAAQAVCAYPVRLVDGMSPPYWALGTSVRLLVELGQPDAAAEAARIGAQTDGVRDDPEALARFADALKQVNLDDASRYADDAIKLIETAEARQPRDEWEQYLQSSARLRNADVRARIADIRARQHRYHEAAQLMQQALQVWPDEKGLVPSRQSLRDRLASYQEKARQQ